MNYLTYAASDVGIRKATNQDSLTLKTGNTCLGPLTFAVICDGMGGLQKGEVASATVIEAFSSWFYNELPNVIQNSDLEQSIRRRWAEILKEANQNLQEYGKKCGFELGTTITAMLFIGDDYYMLNLGDTRAYEIGDQVVQLTKDHSFIAREMAMGRMTPEQAKTDPRRNVLLQCVGASKKIAPDITYGKVRQDTVYLLCSDGFRHEITEREMLHYLSPKQLNSRNDMEQNAMYLIELNKSRKEQDNISVILVRSY
ncbi:protein serine/threonine phosphatase PrpC, regulation of stationary phase [Lachnospiraceae bacterium KM106-2]|nr:protein serine/threonine phosphatase PrpC, regulation of stationary phase [Lachnospiraceae bacterium KM106-2]